MNTLTALADETTVRLRLRLLALARRQDDLAAEEAAATPYWKPQSATVYGHRSAADVLRAEADLLLSGCPS